MRNKSLSLLSKMKYGNLPGDGNHLTLTMSDRDKLIEENHAFKKIIIRLFGAQEFIKGLQRYCLWIDDDDLDLARSSAFVRERIDGARLTRRTSPDPSYNALVDRPLSSVTGIYAESLTILVPTISSEGREYLPTAVFPGRHRHNQPGLCPLRRPYMEHGADRFAPHLVWIATVCGKLETRYRYSNTLGWNTFPVPSSQKRTKLI